MEVIEPRVKDFLTPLQQLRLAEKLQEVVEFSGFGEVIITIARGEIQFIKVVKSEKLQSDDR